MDDRLIRDGRRLVSLVDSMFSGDSKQILTRCQNAMKTLELSEYRCRFKFGIYILCLQEESPKNNQRDRISSFGKSCLS